MANVALQASRRTMARAASPASCGRNPDITLLVLDSKGGTLDPAFSAHALPIVSWAMAIWDRWQPPQVMAHSVERARCKLSRVSSIWSAVTGPATAVLATAWRLGWE
eukprot:11415731-Karenia_brevis.AAC.1